jgi:hypothetical protein
MKPDKLLLELEEVIGRLGYRLRKEKGNFRGSNCVLDGDKIIMLNKNSPIELHIGTLATFIMHQKHEDLFLKPIVRKELESIWNKMEVAAEPEFNFDEN